MGNYLSAYPENAPKYRRDWIPDLRTNTDNRFIIRNSKYTYKADLRDQLDNLPPQPADDPITLTYHCGAAYAVATAYAIALKSEKCFNDLDICKKGASTAYVYWNARKYEGVTSDEGCSIRSCLYSLLEKGMIPEDKFALNYYGVLKDPYWLDVDASKAPKIEMYRIVKEARAIIQALENKHPVMLGYVLHENMFENNEDEILRYKEQDRKDELKIRGGYVGVVVHYDANTRDFLIHGTPFPKRSKMLLSAESLRSACIGDIWCIKIVPTL